MPRGSSYRGGEIMRKRIIVAGSGGAGLTAAIAAAKKGAEVLLLSKTSCAAGSCTAYSGGMFSLASGSVTPEEHFKKVIEVGRSAGDPELVRTLSEHCEASLRTLSDWGITMKIGEGRAHVRASAPSEIMGGAGMTGELCALARAEGVKILENCAATRILSAGGRVEGLEWVDWKTGREWRSCASAVILATGGGGAIYSRTDNPYRMTGDGYAMALEAGLDLADMEYVQFYPLGWKDPAFPVWMVGLTAMDYIPVTDGKGREFLKEAILSWGLSSGKEANYFARDRCASFLARHEKDGGKTYLHIEKLADDMLSLPDLRVSLMVDLPPRRRMRPVEVSPIQHYFTGGVPIDSEGRTSLPGLYACGEVTAGVDGASRMGGNALTNIVTFGLRAGGAAAEEGASAPGGGPEKIAGPNLALLLTGDDRPGKAREDLKGIVQEGLGPCRSGEGLVRCIDALEEWKSANRAFRADSSMDLLHALEMKGMIATAEGVARAAMLREESRGVHFREDFPSEIEEQRGTISVSLRGGVLTASREE